MSFHSPNSYKNLSDSIQLKKKNPYLPTHSQNCESGDSKKLFF